MAQTREMGGLAGWVVAAMRRGRVRSEARAMQVVETISLGGRRTLTLVSVRGQEFLVGGGVDRVEAIVAVHEGVEL